VVPLDIYRPRLDGLDDGFLIEKTSSTGAAHSLKGAPTFDQSAIDAVLANTAKRLKEWTAIDSKGHAGAQSPRDPDSPKSMPRLLGRGQGNILRQWGMTQGSTGPGYLLSHLRWLIGTM